MNIEFQKNDRSNPSKPRFIFEDHNDFIKREPVINKEVEISPVIDAVKTEQDEPNQSDKNDLNIVIETKLNSPTEYQAKVLKTFAPNKAEIVKHYTISTSENSNNPIVPELIENNLPNETHFEIKSETIEPIAEVDVKEHVTFEPFVEVDIKENIVKSEENVVKQPLGIEDVRDNLNNGKSVLKDTVQNVVNLSTPIVIEDTNKITCMYCELRVKDLNQLAIHTHNFHYKSQYSFKNNKIRYIKQCFKACHHCEYQTERKANLVKHIFARHMPKKDKIVRKRAKYTCNFCDKKFATKCEMYEHNKTHNGKISSYECAHRSLKSLKMHVNAPGIKHFACNLCNHFACTSGTLKYHMTRVHDIKSVAYNCDHCQSSFSQKDHLIAHLKLQSHDYTSDYKCPYTNNKNYINDNDSKYDYDTYLTKEVPQSTEEEKNLIDNYKMQPESYECGTCPFKCTNRLHLKAHISRHNSRLKKKPVPVEKKYSCQFCKFKSMTQKPLNEHLKKNHQHLRPYFCKLCDCKYSVMNELVKHIKFIHFMRKK